MEQTNSESLKIDIIQLVSAFCGETEQNFAGFDFVPDSFSEDEYHRGVSISYEVLINGRKIILSGTLPGIFYKDGMIFADFPASNPEITGKTASLVFSYIILKKKNKEKIIIRTFSKSKGEIFIKENETDFSKAEEQFKKVLGFLGKSLPLFNKEQKNIVFPYKSLRQGQKELIKSVWNAVKSKSSLYCSAPTGIGKTYAVLYPALKALETSKAEKIIYIAPKSTLKKQVAESVKKLQPDGIKTVTVVLDAKMKICPEKMQECIFDACLYGNEFKSRLGEAISSLAEEKFLDKEIFVSCGKKYGVCPFELSLAMIKFADIVICDYNYVFDMNASILNLFGKNAVLLCDESHNLPDRIKESYSESITPSDFDVFFKSVSPLNTEIKTLCEKIMGEFESNRREYSEKKKDFSKLGDTQFFETARELFGKISFLKNGYKNLSDSESRNLTELWKKLKKFSALSKIYDDSFRLINYPDGGKKIYPVSVEKIMESVKERFLSCTFFSATLVPFEYYGEVLCKTDSDSFLELDNPFEKDNLFVGLCDVDVNYKNRVLTAKKLCNIIKTATGIKKGNYMVFLPSFEYLEYLVQEYKKTSFSDTVIFQKRDMSYSEKTVFIEEFRKNRKTSLVAFAVLGGSFAEGIDLAGDMLSGEIIVGTGFPPPSAEKEAESDYYNEKELNGRSLVYTLSGFNKVLQASGRVIRTESDRGFILLCDTRFLYEDMKELFPSAWSDAKIISGEKELLSELEHFGL